MQIQVGLETRPRPWLPEVVDPYQLGVIWHQSSLGSKRNIRRERKQEKKGQIPQFQPAQLSELAWLEHQSRCDQDGGGKSRLKQPGSSTRHSHSSKLHPVKTPVQGQGRVVRGGTLGSQSSSEVLPWPGQALQHQAAQTHPGWGWAGSGTELSCQSRHHIRAMRAEPQASALQVLCFSLLLSNRHQINFPGTCSEQIEAC